MKKITFLCFTLIISILSWEGKAQAGATCDNPLVVTSMPFNDSGNTATYGNNYASADVPVVASDAVTNGTGNTSYISGHEVVYSYTASSDGSISIETTNDDDWIGLWAFIDCPFESTVGYDTATGGSTRAIPSLPVEEGQTYYIVISTWSPPESTDYTINITRTNVGDPVTCAQPDNLIVSNITEDSADLMWDEAGTATEWEVEYGVTGFAQGSGTTLLESDTPGVSISELSSGTTYDFYVKAICSPIDSSAITGPITFATNCSPSSLPYELTFEIGEECVTYENAGQGNDWEIYTGTGNGFSGVHARYAYHTTSPADAWLFTNGVELIEGMEYEISYTFGNNSTSYTEKMKVAGGTSNTAAGMFFELADHDDISDGTPETNTITFIAPTSDVYYLGFNAYSDSNEFYLYLDDISAEMVSTCLEPSGIDISNITDSSADVSWTENGTATEWEIEYGISGFTQGSGTVVADNDGELGETLTDLESETDYDVYVRAICSDTNMSDWIGPENFVTATLHVNDNHFKDFTYYPNPMTDVINIRSQNEKYELTIFNLIGQKLLTHKMEANTASLDVSSFASGAYLMQVTSSSGETTSYKLIKK